MKRLICELEGMCRGIAHFRPLGRTLSSFSAFSALKVSSARPSSPRKGRNSPMFLLNSSSTVEVKVKVLQAQKFHKAISFYLVATWQFIHFTVTR